MDNSVKKVIQVWNYIRVSIYWWAVSLTITHSHTFSPSGMADFQYLATHNDPDGNQMSLYDKIILRKPEKKEFYDNPVPLFLPPPIFSRLDTAVDYYYRPDVLHR